jgi:hypothetical protein
MGTRLTEIVVDCHDPGAQAAFWAAALGYHVVRSEIGQVEIGPWEREPADLAERVLELGARRAGVGQGQVPWACSPTRKATSSASWARSTTTPSALAGLGFTRVASEPVGTARTRRRP